MFYQSGHLMFLFWRSATTLTIEEVTGIVQAHSARVVTAGCRTICISRGNVWTAALRQFSRCSFANRADMLRVTFAGDEGASEDAEDLGGPRREFFRLLGKAVFKDNGAFEGDLYSNVHFICTTVLLTSFRYYLWCPHQFLQYFVCFFYDFCCLNAWFHSSILYLLTDGATLAFIIRTQRRNKVVVSQRGGAEPRDTPGRTQENAITSALISALKYMDFYEKLNIYHSVLKQCAALENVQTDQLKH